MGPPAEHPTDRHRHGLGPRRRARGSRHHGAAPAHAHRPATDAGHLTASGRSGPVNPLGAVVQSAHPRRRSDRREQLPALERQPRLLPTSRTRRDRCTPGRHPGRPQPRQPPRLAHHTRTTRALAGPSRRTHRRPAPRQGHQNPRPTQTPDRLTDPARAIHTTRRGRQPARKPARDSETGFTAYEIGTG